MPKNNKIQTVFAFTQNYLEQSNYVSLCLLWFKYILFRKEHSTSIAFAYNINETDQNESNCLLSFSPIYKTPIVFQPDCISPSEIMSTLMIFFAI